MHRMCTYILAMMGWEGVGRGCTVPPLRTVAYKNRNVWVQLSGPLRADWKTRPAAQRPRWTAYSQALVHCKQPINHVQVWAVHTYMAMHKRVLYTSHLRRKIGSRPLLCTDRYMLLSRKLTICNPCATHAIQTDDRRCTDMSHATYDSEHLSSHASVCLGLAVVNGCIYTTDIRACTLKEQATELRWGQRCMEDR